MITYTFKGVDQINTIICKNNGAHIKSISTKDGAVLTEYRCSVEEAEDIRDLFRNDHVNEWEATVEHDHS